MAGRRTLTSIGAPAVPALIAIVEGEDENARDVAIEALIDIGGDAREALPSLIRIAFDTDLYDSRRDEAVQALGLVGAPDDRALDALLLLVGHDDFGIRLAAVEALGCFAPSCPEAVTVLERSLADPEPGVIELAAISLGRYGPVGKKAVPHLRRILGDERALDLKVEGALEALAELGPVAGPAQPEVETYLDDEEFGHRVRAALAFWRITGRQGKPVAVLMQELRSAGGWKYGSQGEQALARIGGPAISSLLRALRDRNKSTRRRAAETLAGFGDAADDVVPALIAALEDPSKGVRYAAAEALEQIGPAAKDAVPALERAWHVDGDRDVRRAAYRAWKKLGGRLR